MTKQAILLKESHCRWNWRDNLLKKWSISHRYYYSVSRKQTVPTLHAIASQNIATPIIKLTQITIQVTTEAAANYIYIFMVIIFAPLAKPISTIVPGAAAVIMIWTLLDWSERGLSWCPCIHNSKPEDLLITHAFVCHARLFSEMLGNEATGFRPGYGSEGKRSR